MPCPRPLDPIDAEAIAAGADPILASDADSHARDCATCGALVRSAERLSEALEGLSGAVPTVPGLADRVTRLRAFSPRERRTYALWRAPALLELSLGIAGIALLALPALTASEQLTVGAMALAPLAGLTRSVQQWAIDLVRLAPVGLGALADGLRRDSALGLLALGLLAPAALGLRRVLAHVPGRR